MHQGSRDLVHHSVIHTMSFIIGQCYGAHTFNLTFLSVPDNTSIQEVLPVYASDTQSLTKVAVIVNQTVSFMKCCLSGVIS